MEYEEGDEEERKKRLKIDKEVIKAQEEKKPWKGRKWL